MTQQVKCVEGYHFIFARVRHLLRARNYLDVFANQSVVEFNVCQPILQHEKHREMGSKT
jgi:hypothetical protein